MLVLGNDDIRTAEHAAQLYIEGWATQIVISGQEGSGTRGRGSTIYIPESLSLELMFVCVTFHLLDRSLIG